jgi:hypothetical protein
MEKLQFLPLGLRVNEVSLFPAQLNAPVVDIPNWQQYNMTRTHQLV